APLLAAHAGADERPVRLGRRQSLVPQVHRESRRVPDGGGDRALPRRRRPLGAVERRGQTENDLLRPLVARETRDLRDDRVVVFRFDDRQGVRDPERADRDPGPTGPEVHAERARHPPSASRAASPASRNASAIPSGRFPPPVARSSLPPAPPPIAFAAPARIAFAEIPRPTRSLDTAAATPAFPSTPDPRTTAPGPRRASRTDIASLPRSPTPRPGTSATTSDASPTGSALAASAPA